MLPQDQQMRSKGSNMSGSDRSNSNRCPYSRLETREDRAVVACYAQPNDFDSRTDSFVQPICPGNGRCDYRAAAEALRVPHAPRSGDISSQLTA